MPPSAVGFSAAWATGPPASVPFGQKPPVWRLYGTLPHGSVPVPLCLPLVRLSGRGKGVTWDGAVTLTRSWRDTVNMLLRGLRVHKPSGVAAFNVPAEKTRAPWVNIKVQHAYRGTLVLGRSNS